MHGLLEELAVCSIITTKASSLWYKDIDLGVITKILGHQDISSSVEVYTHTLEEKVFKPEVFGKIAHKKMWGKKWGEMILEQAKKPTE